MVVPSVARANTSPSALGSHGRIAPVVRLQAPSRFRVTCAPPAGGIRAMNLPAKYAVLEAGETRIFWTRRASASVCESPVIGPVAWHMGDGTALAAAA